MMRTDADVLADYQVRASAHRVLRHRAATAANRTGHARLAVFALGVAGTAWALVTHAPPAASACLGLGSAAVFSWLVMRHRRAMAAARFEDALSRACDVGAHRVRREWTQLPTSAFAEPPASHPFAPDVNVFGDVSLARLLGPVSALAGRAVVSEWLLAESPPHTTQLRARQTAIAELAGHAEWRERFGVLGSRVAHDRASIEPFLAWAEGDEHFINARRTWVARLLTLVSVAALIVVVAHPDWWMLLSVPCGANLLFAATMRADIRAGLAFASAIGFSLGGIVEMFRHTLGQPVEAPDLHALHDRMDARQAIAAFTRLARIASCGELRFSPMGHAILQLLFLWDVHVVSALGTWRVAHGRYARDRIRALGELEAIAALATLAHDNPTWTWPAFSDNGPSILQAAALAHPLVSAEVRVANDVVVGPPGTFLLVTGSNMAGKSTLLRSIGLNIVLAQIGAPVCATAFTTPLLRLRTSIHVHDALEAGVSLFMAELLRLESIVAAARVVDGPPLLYLADEMLHGTNTTERRIAVVAVITHLLRAGAIGAVATHDVELAREPSLAPHAHAIHFMEQYHDGAAGPVMSFDYRARAGTATSGNALKLLALVGLGPP